MIIGQASEHCFQDFHPLFCFFFFSQQCAGLVVGCMMISVCYWGNILTTIHLLSHLTAWDLLNLHVCRLCEEMAYPEEIDNIQIPQWKVPLTYWLKIEYLLLLKFRIFILEASSSCHTLFSHSHLQGIKMPSGKSLQLTTENDPSCILMKYRLGEGNQSCLFPLINHIYSSLFHCVSPHSLKQREQILLI